jgi:hypothetical protein
MEDFFTVCPSPDAKWFVEKGLKPILRDLVTRALSQYGSEQAQAACEKAAKIIGEECFRTNRGAQRAIERIRASAAEEQGRKP